MSKHCLSRAAHCPERFPAREIAWQQRVFRNSYTRKGRRYWIKRWACKIQYQGKRRTFSLAARTRRAAARQAQHLYKVLRTQGWDAAIKLQRKPRPAGTTPTLLSKHDAAYWQPRLIQRRYREARLSPGQEYSARIDHDGSYAYFPLGSDQLDPAAAKAQAIYQMLCTAGWPAVCQRYERELTLAIFWSDNPAAVTYTTLFTFIGPPPDCPARAPRSAESPRQLTLLEPDLTVHSTLRYWLDQQPGFKCQKVFSSAEEALGRFDARNTALMLVNRTVPNAAQVLEQLKVCRPELPVFTYRIHEDSDQIFISISGVTGGYILRRRLPTALFEPLQGVLPSGPLSARETTRQIQTYFQSFFGQPPPESGAPPEADLTHREQEILHHVSKGCLDKEIADNLKISVWTVHNHLKNIYEKLNVHNRTEAVLKYLQK